MSKEEIHYDWSKKGSMSDIAQKHTNTMQKQYSDEITHCIENTNIYLHGIAGKDFYENEQYKTECLVEDTDSVSALLKYASDGTAVLNFASYKYPGGGFLQGSIAQEECLCHKSFLYNVISHPKFLKEYYEHNNKNLNRALYKDCALYTPNVRFIDGEKTAVVNVLTCAAPNKSTALDYAGATERDNFEALKSRIDFVLGLMAHHKNTTLILGAFGCGVFGQNPFEVATIFNELINTKYSGTFKRIVYAIPNSKYNSNLHTFEKVVLNK